MATAQNTVRVAASKITVDDIIQNRDKQQMRVRLIERTQAGTWFFGPTYPAGGRTNTSRFVPSGGKVTRWADDIEVYAEHVEQGVECRTLDGQDGN